MEEWKANRRSGGRRSLNSSAQLLFFTLPETGSLPEGLGAKAQVRVV